jgi:hypothetical protein
MKMGSTPPSEFTASDEKLRAGLKSAEETIQKGAETMRGLSPEVIAEIGRRIEIPEPEIPQFVQDMIKFGERAGTASR